MMEGGYLFYKDILPFTVMVALECANVGVNTLFKAATMKGMSYYVFIFYSFAIAALILLPSPLFYRRTLLPSLNSRIIAKLFLLGLTGSIGVQFGYKGIEYGSPTLASAMSNLIPAFTFILAIFFRMEKLTLRSSSSQAKILGTVVSTIGALTVILYKGPAVIFTPMNSSMPYVKLLNSLNSIWVIGGILLSIENILIPIWYIIQAQIIKEYPAELVMIFFYNLFGAIISGAVALVAEPDRSAWILKPDISLAAILFSGLINSFLANSCRAWILRYKGPVYVAMFKPLSIAIAGAMSVLFLGDTLYLGSIIGAAVISLGFYAVLWGKATEELYEDHGTEDLESPSKNLKVPLLQSSS